MKVKKILNNNIAIIDKGGHESIIFSPGISFKKKVGQKIIESEIEKTYVLDSKDRLEHFSYLLANSDEGTIDLINELVAYGEQKLNQKANDYLYLTLLDHIIFAISRGKKAQFIRSPLTWEVKKFYPLHYGIGYHGLKLIEAYTQLEFPDDEAVSIALHFVNLQETQSNVTEKLEDMEALKDILTIIKYHFKLIFDESSLNYLRLVTHLQYFIERLRRQAFYEESESVLYNQVKELYPEAFMVVEKIEVYIQKRFNQTLSRDEYTYLMLHINRVTEKEGK